MMDYSLCNQTVTIYRRDEKGLQRKVLEGCYFAYRDEQKETELGYFRQRPCLLILPAGVGDVRIGDKVYRGVGPSITASAWGSFLPSTVAGLSEINYVIPCYWDGELIHTEAGRK